jgi:superfamily II DNA or RNA helicase
MSVEFVFDTIKQKPQIVSEFLSLIREYFSIEDKALVFLRRRTGRTNMPVRKYIISNAGHFDLPLFRTICDGIKLNFPNLQITISNELLKKIQPANIANEPDQLKLLPRDYQHESAKIALQTGLGIIVLPTSAGKTLTIALIASTALKRNSELNVLILVPNIQLVEQTYNDFIEYGVNLNLISRWTGSHEYQHARIVIANNQILLSKAQDISVLKQFGMLICDEVHKIGTAEKISTLIKKLPAKYKFGFTGSLPENKFDVWNINKIFGPVIYTKHSTELRQENFISNVRVVSLLIEYNNIPVFTKPTMTNPSIGWTEELEWIQNNVYRNNVLYKLITKLETNTLVLVDRIEHGEILLNKFKENNLKQIFFIRGSVAVEDREEVKKIMEINNNVVCIAMSNIFSTGISIKNLHNVIFASIGKARIKIIQSIGRTLRLHHSKTVATIFDIADYNLRYGYQHYQERQTIYNQENIPITTNKLVEK